MNMKMCKDSNIVVYIAAGLMIGAAAGIAMQCLKGRKSRVKRSIGAMMDTLADALENAAENMK